MISSLSFADIKVYWTGILEDNFQYLIFLNKSRQWICIDPGDWHAISKIMDCEIHNGLAAVLITHAHDDHIGALSDLLSHQWVKKPVVLFSGSSDYLHEMIIKHKEHLSDMIDVREFQKLKIEDLDIEVIPMPGHTSEQLTFYIPKFSIAFTGDLLFHLGCGRIFNGSYLEHFESLHRLIELDRALCAFPSHDYSKANKEFLKNKLGLHDIELYPHMHKIPICLREEIKWNPFLKTNNLEEFTTLRMRRNLG